MGIKPMSHLPRLSAGEMVELLGKSYLALIRSGRPFASFPATMLWGPPGVGKSQGVRQIADYLHKETGKPVHITDVRLLLFNPVDLRGIPTVNKDRTRSIWLKPEIFDMDESPDVINILFLDEITAAPASVQAAAYQITLDRRIGEHPLPANCLVILAGNRASDRSVGGNMPKALANRLIHFEIEADFDAFFAWALEHHLDQRILGYLSFDKEALMAFSPDDDSKAFATPRSWEMVSNILTNIEPDLSKARPLIEGLISKGQANKFITYCRVYRKLPKITDIFGGKGNFAPKEVDALYALVGALTSHAYAHQGDLEGIANSIEYADDYLPPDFSFLLIDNYKRFGKEFQNRISGLESYRKWAMHKGNLLNG